MHSSENLSRPKVIAFDFDETISDNPALFLNVMKTFEESGFHVVVVTYRKSNCYPEDLDFLLDKGYKVYFTGHKAKDEFMREEGIHVDIWVDDEPRTIVESWDAYRGKFV